MGGSHCGRGQGPSRTVVPRKEVPEKETLTYNVYVGSSHEEEAKTPLAEFITVEGLHAHDSVKSKQSHMDNFI